jgi:RND family efflux transporter MFP subunit
MSAEISPQTPEGSQITQTEANDGPPNPSGLGAALSSDDPKKFLFWHVLQRTDLRMILIIFLAVVSIPIWRATTGHAKTTHPLLPSAVPIAVAKVTREDLVRELVCDAELRPYQEVDLHAKVAGYLEKIYVDIGDRVEAGQLLATIEVPELGDDIIRARATLKRSQEEVRRAQAADDDARLVYTRLESVDKAQPNLIAQQELDAALQKQRGSASAVAAARAEVDVTTAEVNKLLTMQKYSRISAPFGGVITKRYADPGALIQAGTSSSTQTLPLVRLSQNDRLRLSIPISVSHVSKINIGDPVSIQVAALGTTLKGSIARSTRKIETTTRTMEVEVDVPNSELKLIPGMYASAMLRLDHCEKTLAVPVEAVSRKDACTVFVVIRENKIEERLVTLGMETPHKLQVLSGLNENDLVMIGSRAQIKPGQQIEPRLLEEHASAE